MFKNKVIYKKVVSKGWCKESSLKPYVHGKQLRSCGDGQLLNHIDPGQASQRQFTKIKCPLFRQLLTSCSSWISGEGKNFLRKNMPDRSVDLGTAAYEADMLLTKLLCSFKTNHTLYCLNC